ncbi:Rv2231c family pyridoxal phosphate-dependent protein CobC [Streptomyces iconiensis]|uniref:Aminotransferase n=1 Tax=Streptomyces iconiensis TaxID=1384038 RepID=A0ABT6ZVG9_9ACTN|nr:Rv2231c family pyridoxal phosphate-dependent protein CobC [Streptomyces iconiensis]MDJ1133070.1 Rv2231c family pyridoxal phosphate-dependent protein CobC [Streptomyces iconiensis]
MSAEQPLTVGVGACEGVGADEVLDLVRAVLEAVGPSAEARVAALATVEARAGEPALVAVAEKLGVPLRAYGSAELARIRVPHPSDFSRAAMGTPSVAEAAALLASGGTLLVPKTRSAPADGAPARATAAVALGTPGAGRNGQDRRDGARRAQHAGPYERYGIRDAQHAGPDGRRAEQAGREPDLRHHGDAEVRGAGAGLTDLAVNVRTGTPPAWLRSRLAESLEGLAAYPDAGAARRAVAARHGVPVDSVLLTAGAAEAFVLVARGIEARCAAVVHPQFTEPEAALLDAGHAVERVLLRADEDFALTPGAVPEAADLVVVGNPTNPTSVLHPAAALAGLAREGRTLVVDEAFIDAVPGERESLVPSLGLLPGRTVVLRSLTKTWGLAGLRIGYVLADPGTVRALARHQPLWPVSAPALTAAEACSTPGALAEAEAAAREFAADRAYLSGRLAEFGHGHEGLRTATPYPEAPFLLVRHPEARAVRERLRGLGFAVRRGDTFPGLGEDWFRMAVRDRATTDRFLTALDTALSHPT